MRDSRSVWGFTLVVACTFFVYIYTLCPTVYAGDSGELSLAGYTHGVPHPPGYPVFVLFGRLACLAAAGKIEPAAVTNTLCALFAALTAACIFLLLYRVMSSLIVAISGACLLAFSATFWGQATTTEVYPLVCLGFCCVLLCVEVLERKPSAGAVYLLVYLAGQLLTLHQSMILVLPALFYMFFLNRRRISVVKAAMLFVLGFSPYLLVMFRSKADPLIDWGDPESPGRWLALLLRTNYGDLQQNSFSIGLLIGNVQVFFNRLIHEIPLPFLLFAPVGLHGLNRERPHLAKFMALAFLGLVAGLIVLINPALDSVHIYQMSFYFLPAYVLFAVWAAVGFLYLVQWLERMARAAGESSSGEHSVYTAGLVHALVACALLAPVWMVAENLEASNRRDFFDARVYGENIFRSLPEGATLVTDGDNETFILAYLQQALGYRPDVRLAHRKGYLFEAPSWIRHSTRGDLGRNSARWQRELLSGGGAVYYATYSNLSAIAPGWSLEREGIVYRAVGAGDTPELPPSRSGQLLRAYDTTVLGRNPGTMEFVSRKFAIGYLEAMWELTNTTHRTAGDLLDSIRDMGHDFSEAQFFVGSQLEQTGDLQGALQAYRRSARLDPNAPYSRDAITRLLYATEFSH